MRRDLYYKKEVRREFENFGNLWPNLYNMLNFFFPAEIGPGRFGLVNQLCAILRLFVIERLIVQQPRRFFKTFCVTKGRKGEGKFSKKGLYVGKTGNNSSWGKMQHLRCFIMEFIALCYHSTHT